MRYAVNPLLRRWGIGLILTLMFGVHAASAAAQPPSAPQSVLASPASSQALVSWSAPSSDGGSSITGYTVTPYVGSTAETPVSAGASATSATVTGLTNGTAYTFTVTATNANGTGPASAASAAVTPEDTILDFSGSPVNVDSGDTSSVELGVKFDASSTGSVTGIRFYEAATNTGTHVGSLWSASGTLLASATFSNETGSGWQTVNFSSPVSITAGTTYVAGYFAPNGHYSSSPGALSAAVSNGPLTAIANGISSNGVYAYAGSSTFPSNSYNATSYWVDVLFAPTPLTAPGQVTGVSATAGSLSASVSWSAPSSGGVPSSYTVTPYIGSSAQTPTTVSGSTTSTTITGLTAGTAYTFVVQASNSAGQGQASVASNAVTPTGPLAPSAPQGVLASPASSQALVSWSAPSSNGGSSITGYTVTPYVGSTAGTPVSAGASATSATVTGLTNGTAYTFTVTATNAIGTGPASAASAAVTPEDTIFDFSAPAAGNIDSGDTTSVEVGVEFTASSPGSVTGIRFYKASTNTGTHVGSLWTSSGTLLASATFSNETGSGWQTVNFSSPVAITAGTSYVAGYFASNGHYSGTGQGFGAAVSNGPLTAIANGTTPNGVYAYAGSSTFPTNSYNAGNYWVDVLFAPTPLTAPGQVTGVSATAGSLSASVSWSAPSSGGAPSSYTVTPYIGSTAQTPTTVSGSTTSTTITGLTAGTAYTFVAQASNSAGQGPASAASNSVTPTGAGVPSAPQSVSASPASSQALVSWSAPSSNGGSSITGYTVTPYAGSTAGTPVSAGASATSATVTGLTNGTAYTFNVAATNSVGTGASAASSALTPEDTIFDFSTPAAGNVDSGDSSPVEVGVTFTASPSGSVTGIRFYKATTNTGTHVGSLWTSSGTLLASATFSNESASGWQTVSFSSPVAITAGTSYVAGYFAPNGHYSATGQGFGAAVSNGPLTAVANGTTPNGVYAYAGSSTFPTSSYNAGNYWVDVLFAPTPLTAPGQVTGVSATAGSLSASVSWSAPSSGGAPSSYSVTPYIGSTAQTPTSVSGSTTSTTITGLTAGTAYTFVVQASNSAGQGPASAASNSVTPTGAGVPSAPQSVSASPASSQALVSWSAPSSNGGSSITGYTVTPYVGSTAETPVSAGASATSATITGLTNGTAYTFNVAATNSVGTGASSASSAVTPEDTIFDFSTPAAGNIDAGDSSPVEVGVEFTAASGGSVTGIRFYKASTNTGTHVGSLWTSSGTLLASATFSNESASGWQTVSFSSPVAIGAGTTYVAGYYAPNGHYSATGQGFGAAVSNGPLTAVANGTTPNGVYAYAGSSTFPTSSYNAANYWVDVLVAPATNSAPGQPTNVTATPRADAASVSWSAPVTGGVVSTYTITPYAGSVAQIPTTVSGSPAPTSAMVNGLIPGNSYTFVVQGSNSAGPGPASAPSNTVTAEAGTAPSAPQSVSASPASSRALVSWSAPSSDGGSSITGYTITPYIGSTAQSEVSVNNGSATSADVTGLALGTGYTFTVTATNSVGTSPASAPSAAVTPEFTIFDFSAPAAGNIDSGDTSPLEVGIKFTADSAGSVNGIRFYKAATNTGTHIGSLWTNGGQLLAQATFSNETASGWQTVNFSNPVAITAGNTYVAGYFAPNGHYSGTSGGLDAEVDNAPLHSIANGTSANGVYAYGGSSTFPSETYNGANYWVDVMFAPSATNSTPGQPTNVTATPGYTSATVTWTAGWDGGSPITSYTITPYIGSSAQTPTTISPATSATVNGLTNGTSYTFTVAASNANGTGPASAPTSAVTPDPQPTGEWSAPMNWPLVAIHSVLLDTGNVLVWDGWHQPEPTQEYDPTTGTFTNPINAPDGIFCSAMAQLPDGDVLVVGGYGELSTGNLGIVDTNIYDPTTGTWTRVANMNYPRWYPSLTELADGDYVVVSGKSSNFGTWADTPEVYDPTSNTWTLLSGVSTSGIHELEYPNSYLLPNGNVFVLGPQEDQSYELNMNNQTFTQVAGSSGVVNGGSIMYQPGKILYAGGAASLGSPSNAQANAAVIDLTAQNPQWQTIAPMANARAFNTMTMLADGTVLAIGGEPVTGQPNGQGEVSGGVLPAEIWNPNTEQWTTVASMAVTRGYHTSMVLLPSGQVLVAGSGHAAPGEPGQYSSQIYSPPYLFEGSRPTITSAPSSATYGSNITISTPNAASIQAVNLVDLGASTHQMDFDQHFVPLSFTSGSGTLTVQTPSSGTYAPPGNYMVFIVNSNGVPSVASIINIAASGSGPQAVQLTRASAISATAARVSWSAPLAGGRPIKGYTVTPYVGAKALTPISVSGSPAATSTTIKGLKSGATYTFKVRAKNAVGTGPSSRPSNSVTPAATPDPAFVQQTSAYADTTASVALRFRSILVARDRIVVESTVWGRGATTASVTDSAGDKYTELRDSVAPDGTDMSVWTATVIPGKTTRPTITVTPSSPADVGAIALDYSGLSTAPGMSAVDRIVADGGTTRRLATVGSDPTPPTTADKELAVGLYADSGFGDDLHVGRGFNQRINISPTSTMMEQLVEDRVINAGSTPDATVRTGAGTPWLMDQIVFKAAASGGPAKDARPHSGSSQTNLRTVPEASLRAFELAKLIPLSRRPRPHLLAGEITEFVGKGPDGQLIHYYCLADPSGKALKNELVEANAANSILPAGLPAYRPSKR
jgi:hypothetical protein